MKLKEKKTDDVFTDAVSSLKKEIKDVIMQLNKEKNTKKKSVTSISSVGFLVYFSLMVSVCS